MVFDSHNGHALLFGVDNYYDNAETWIFNFTTYNWIQKAPLTHPGLRKWCSMVFDTSGNKSILVGGRWRSTRYADTLCYLGSSYSEYGILESNYTSVNYIYSCQGYVSWDTLIQPQNTSLTVQIGLSNTTNEEDFRFTSGSNSSFMFNELFKYFKYRVVFSSNEFQSLTPRLGHINTSLLLEKPKPSVFISTPQNLSIINGVILISAIVDSPNGIQNVSFYFDDLLFVNLINSPYNFTWNSKSLPNGEYSLTVVVTSVLGRKSYSTVSFSINNLVTTIPTNPLTVPSPPRSLEGTPGENVVTLTWNNPVTDGGSAITEYRVYRGTEKGKYSQIFIVSPVKYTFNDTLVLGDVTYYYVVTARNLFGESKLSNEVKITPLGETIPKRGAYPKISFILLFFGCFTVLKRKRIKEKFKLKIIR
jgi:hypothetical protein